MIVTARHPALIDHIPPRSRKSRRQVVSVSTPVRIPEDRDAAFDGVAVATDPDARWNADARLFLRDGTAYRRLLAKPGGDPIRPSDLADYLGTGICPRDRNAGHALWRETWRTPLLATVLVDAPLGMHKEDQQRGVALGDGQLGRVGRDDRPRAAADAARFLEAEFVVTGDFVYRRYRPLATVEAGKPARLVDTPHLGLSLYHRPEHGIWLPARADRYADAATAWGWDIAPPDANLARALAALPASAHGDDDLALLANHVPSTIRHHLGSRMPVRTEARSPAHAAAYAAIVGLERLAATGAIRDEGVAPALDVIRDAIGAAQELATDRLRPDIDAVHALDEYLSSFALPRLRPEGVRLPDGDADALDLALR